MYFALLTFVIYFLQLTKDIYSGDIGDLVTSACVGGVPHPPGYPLFTLIGHFLCSLPFSIPPVTRVALISAIAGALSVYFFYRFSKRVTNNIFFSLLSSLILSFSYLFWLHAELPEVFGLHNFFVIALIYFAYDYYEKSSASKLYRLAGLTGLALTHHQTILFIGPTLAIFVFSKWRELFKQQLTILYAILIAIAGFLLPYIYVFIVGSKDSIMNWDIVTDVKSLTHLILRKSYGGFAPSVKNGIPLAVKSAVVRDYFNTFVSNFSYQGIFLGILGILQTFRKKKIAGAALLTGFISAGPLFVAYAATYYTTTTAFGIIERFYSTSFDIFLFFIPFGFVFLDEFLTRFTKKPLLRFILLSYFLILPVFMVIYNHPKTDLSKTQIGNQLAFDILDNLPRNTVLFTSGDTTTFNLWYAHFVLHRRSDIDIVNPPGVGSNNFLNDELTKYHLRHKDKKVALLMQPTIDEIYKRRPVFTTYESEIRPSHTIFLPRGLVYQIINQGESPSEKNYISLVTEDVRKLHRTRSETLTLAEQNLVATEIPLIYSNAHVRIADFIDSQYKDPKTAENFYRLALWRNEENSAAYAGLALSQFKGYNDCNSALSNINRAIDIYPVWNTFYVQRYIIAKRCNIKQPIMKSYKQDYSKRFQNNIDEILKNKYHLTN